MLLPNDELTLATPLLPLLLVLPVLVLCALYGVAGEDATDETSDELAGDEIEKLNPPAPPPPPPLIPPDRPFGPTVADELRCVGEASKSGANKCLGGDGVVMLPVNAAAAAVAAAAEAKLFGPDGSISGANDFGGEYAEAAYSSPLTVGDGAADVAINPWCCTFNFLGDSSSTAGRG